MGSPAYVELMFCGQVKSGQVRADVKSISVKVCRDIDS